MSLVSKPAMTDRNLAAHQANAQQSQGAATDAGKERTSAANLRHGCYSVLSDEALIALGEDPAVLAELMESAHDHWQPADSHEAWMAERLARLQWIINRCDRLQENVVARNLRRLHDHRANQARQARLQYNDLDAFHSTLLHNSLRPDFYSLSCHFRNFNRLGPFNGEQNMQRILELLHRLRKPRNHAVYTGELPQGATSLQDWEEFVRLFDNDEVPADPDLPVAEGDDRNELREELHNLVALEQRLNKEVWEGNTLPEIETRLGQLETDALFITYQKELEPIAKRERSAVREIFALIKTLTNLQDRRTEGGESSRRSRGRNGNHHAEDGLFVGEDFGLSPDLDVEHGNRTAANGAAADSLGVGRAGRANAKSNFKNKSNVEERSNESGSSADKSSGGAVLSARAQAAKAIRSAIAEARSTPFSTAEIEGVSGDIVENTLKGNGILSDLTEHPAIFSEEQQAIVDEIQAQIARQQAA